MEGKRACKKAKKELQEKELRQRLKEEILAEIRRELELKGELPPSQGNAVILPSSCTSRVFTFDERAAISYPCDHVEVPTLCLLVASIVGSDGPPKELAWGQVHPAAPGQMVHNRPLRDGFARVSVDDIIEGCNEFSLPGPPKEDLTTLNNLKGSYMSSGPRQISF